MDVWEHWERPTGPVQDPGWPWPVESAHKHVGEAVDWMLNVVGNRYNKMPDTSWRMVGDYGDIAPPTRMRLALVSDVIVMPQGLFRRKPSALLVGIHWMLHTALISAELEHQTLTRGPGTEDRIFRAIGAVTGKQASIADLFLHPSTVETLTVVRSAWTIDATALRESDLPERPRSSRS